MKIKFDNITKRTLAIFCAFVMTFSNVMAAGTSGKSTSEFSQKDLYAIELLEIIGVYDGVDSIVGKDAFVRRDVMAYLAARVMGVSNIPHHGESYFSDVDKNNFAYNAINILAERKIIKGNGNGKFQPSKDITLDEATEIILRVMGYSQQIDAMGSDICSDLVRDHKLHKGITYAKDKRLQVKHLSTLLYNALTSDYPQIVYIYNGGGFEYKIEKGETLLSKKFDVYETEGVITANGHTSVDVVSDIRDGWVKIGNETYQVGETDADKYVGYYVTAFYHKGDVNTLLCIDVESTNTVVVMDGSDTTYKNFEYTTYVNNREKTYKVSKGLNLIYNGKAIYYDKAKMIPDYGTITLINNNKDEAFDTVIVNSVRNLVVGYYGTTSNIIQSKYDNLPIDLNKYDETMYSIHKADGKPYKPTSLKEWDVLSVLESADGKYLDITVSNESVSGTIEKVTNTDGIEAILIDGIEYEVAKSFYNNSNYNLALGYTGTFYLDMFGRVAAASGKVDQIKWGYIIKTYMNTMGADDKFIIKMLTEDSGAVKMLEAAEKLYVNDKKYTSSAAKYTNSDGDELTLTNFQVVRFSLDKEGKIKRLYTEGDEFIQIAARSSRGFVSNVFVANQVMDIAVNSNTVFLQVPNKAAGDSQTEEEFYGVMPLSSFVRDGWYTVSAYGFEEDEIVAPFVLVERQSSTATTPSGTYMVVSDVDITTDKSGWDVDRITGYDINKNKVEILARDMDVATKFGIEKGDFFAMVLYPDGTLHKAIQIYDYKTGAFNSNYKSRDFNTTNFARFAYAYDLSSNFLLLSDDSSSLTGRKVLNASSATVIIVDSKARKDNIKVGTLSDIQTRKQSSKAAKVVFYGSNSVPRLIVCYQ